MILRVYTVLFLGEPHVASVDLRIRRSELTALVLLRAFLVGGSIWPQPGLDSRHAAAQSVLGIPPHEPGD